MNYLINGSIDGDIIYQAFIATNILKQVDLTISEDGTEFKGKAKPELSVVPGEESPETGICFLREFNFCLVPFKIAKNTVTLTCLNYKVLTQEKLRLS